MPQVVPINLRKFMAERRYQDDAARSAFLHNQSVSGLANRAHHAETVDSGSIPEMELVRIFATRSDR